MRIFPVLFKLFKSYVSRDASQMIMFTRSGNKPGLLLDGFLNAPVFSIPNQNSLLVRRVPGSSCTKTIVQPRNSSWAQKSRVRYWRAWGNTKSRGHLRVRARIPSPVWASIHPVWRRCSSFPYEEYAQSSHLARQVSQHPTRRRYSCANP